MSYAGFCGKCGVPFYETDRLLHQHVEPVSEPASTGEPVPQVDCAKDFGGYPMGTYKGHFYPSPQPVSGDAPDMNDPRYCGACKHIHPPHEVDCRCYCDKVSCPECGPRIAARVMADPAPSPTPSVSTEPQQYKHKPNCLWATPLPTGAGYWGCDCGLDNLLLDLEEYESPSVAGQ